MPVCPSLPSGDGANRERNGKIVYCDHSDETASSSMSKQMTRPSQGACPPFPAWSAGGLPAGLAEHTAPELFSW